MNIDPWMTGDEKAQEAEGAKDAKAFARGEFDGEPPDLVDSSGKPRSDLTPWARGWLRGGDE